MQCGYCQDQAGWLRRTCVECRRLLEIYHAYRGRVGLVQFLDLFIETGFPREKIEAFLRADPRGEGSVMDQITADMSTELLGAMGVQAPQRSQDVKNLRQKGAWRGMGERPKE